MSAVGRRVRAALEPRASRGYIAGPELEDALARARRLARGGLATTIGYWDGPDAAAAAAPGGARSTLVALTGRDADLDACVAVKGPPLLDQPREAVLDIGEAARRAGRRLVVDAPVPEHAGPTLEMAAELRALGGVVGCALPGRWARSLDDAQAAVAHDLTVRVIKGAVPDPAQPGRDPSAGFLAVVERLAGRARLVGVATHDRPLAERALELLRRSGTPCELELLLGMPAPWGAELADAYGVPIRVYVPWGTRGLPYDPSWRRDPRLAGRLLADAIAGARRQRRTLALATG